MAISIFFFLFFVYYRGILSFLEDLRKSKNLVLFTKNDDDDDDDDVWYLWYG